MGVCNGERKREGIRKRRKEEGKRTSKWRRWLSPNPTAAVVQSFACYRLTKWRKAEYCDVNQKRKEGKRKGKRNVNEKRGGRETI